MGYVCPDCEKKIKYGETVCPYCGTQISWPEEQNKEQSEESKEDTSENSIDNSAEKTLIVFAWVVLLCNILVTFVSLELYLFKKAVIDTFVISLLFIPISLFVWALVRVFANISKTLKEINCKMNYSNR